MKRRAVSSVIVTDHALIRYLERALDIDMEAVRALLAEKARVGAQLGATGVKTGKVTLVLQDATVVTVIRRHWHTRDMRSEEERACRR